MQGRKDYTVASADILTRARCILHLCSDIKDTDPQAGPSSVACAEGLGVMNEAAKQSNQRHTALHSQLQRHRVRHKSDTSSTAARRASNAIIAMLFLSATSLGARLVPLLPF